MGLSKLSEIIQGWKNYIIENPIAERTAKLRSNECAKCPHAEKNGLLVLMVGDNLKEIQGYQCSLCDCPLSSLLRSPESKCKENKW